MIKYDKYKSSEIDWLGDIPNDWEVKRVKDLAKTKSGTTPHSQTKKYYSEGIHNWVRTTDLNDGELYEVEYKITDIALEECNMTFLPIDTILVAMYGGFGTIGKNSILKKASTINQSVCAILPSNKLNSEYFLYFLKFFRSSWKIFADGTRKDPNINQEAIKNLFVYFPKVEEQKNIVFFLKTKTQAIDKKINLLTQKASYYKEYRKSLINETVCKGLDKNVKLKDSGVDWIGQIPEHWEVKRFKDVVKEFVGGGTPNTSNKEYWAENEKDGYLWVSIADITNASVITDTKQYITELGLKDCSTKIINPNTILYSIYASLGKVSYSNKFVTTNQAILAVYENEKLINKEFFIHYLKMLEDHIASFGNSNTQNNISLNILRRIFIVFPPTIKEQEEIANYLDDKTQTIDKIVSNINTQIQTLKELRKTLINDAVTGKIKVTND